MDNLDNTCRSGRSGNLIKLGLYSFSQSIDKPLHIPWQRRLEMHSLPCNGVLKRQLHRG